MPDLSIPGAPDAFAAGDIVHLEVPGGGLVPGPAPATIQNGRAAAESILVSVQGGSRMAFHYRGQAAHGHNR